jgi:hypothetical protein
MKYDGKFEFLRGVFFLFFGSFLVSPLEIVSRKSKVPKVFISILFSLLFLSGFAQETHNLEIIWQKASPESVFAFGRCIASGDVNGDSFSDIMIVGDSVLHSANPDSFYRGVCWVYLGGVNPDTILDIRLSNLQKCTFFALHSCDINGDGLDDVILGACNNANAYGEVLIFLGGHHMDTICDYRIRGPSAGSGFGCSIASGDVNGDSFSDLIVGACGYANLKGRVYIYYGGPNFDTNPDVILNGGHQGDYELFGTSVGGKGDVNSDGYQDMIIGAGNFGLSYNGRVYIYFGSFPPDTIADVAMIGEGSNQYLGSYGVDLLINTFGYDKAIFGCEYWPYGIPRIGPGKVYCLFGGYPMDSIPDVWMIGRYDTSGVGNSISSAGDISGISSDAILAGAAWEPGYSGYGAAYVWLSDSNLDTIPDGWIKGNQNYGSIGDAVASAGDVNGDGKDEIMVSNYVSAITPNTVWVCKYTGPGIEERPKQNAEHLTLEVKPNPAKSVVRVRCPVTVKNMKIYDITGKIIRVLDVGKMLESGQYEIRWDLRDDNQKKVATGIYFIEIKSEDKVSEIRKITVVK